MSRGRISLSAKAKRIFTHVIKKFGPDENVEEAEKEHQEQTREQNTCKYKWISDKLDLFTTRIEFSNCKRTIQSLKVARILGAFGFARTSKKEELAGIARKERAQCETDEDDRSGEKRRRDDAATTRERVTKCCEVLSPRAVLWRHSLLSRRPFSTKLLAGLTAHWPGVDHDDDLHERPESDASEEREARQVHEALRFVLARVRRPSQHDEQTERTEDRQQARLPGKHVDNKHARPVPSALRFRLPMLSEMTSCVRSLCRLFHFFPRQNFWRRDLERVVLDNPFFDVS